VARASARLAATRRSSAFGFEPVARSQLILAKVRAELLQPRYAANTAQRLPATRSATVFQLNTVELDLERVERHSRLM